MEFKDLQANSFARCKERSLTSTQGEMVESFLSLERNALPFPHLQDFIKKTTTFFHIFSGFTILSSSTYPIPLSFRKSVVRDVGFWPLPFISSKTRSVSGFLYFCGETLANKRRFMDDPCLLFFFFTSNIVLRLPDLLSVRTEKSKGWIQ